MHMHMQRGVGRAGRGQRIVRRGVEEGAEQDAWRGKVCCEGLEDIGYETFKNTCHASAAGPAGMTQCAYRVRCAAHQHGSVLVLPPAFWCWCYRLPQESACPSGHL